MQVGPLPSAIADGDLNQQILGRFFRIFDEHVEVAVVVEHAGVEQFVFEFIAPAAAAGVDKIGIGKRRLRILVQVFHVRVRGRAVEIEIVFLDVFAVVALAVGQAEQTLLEDRVFAVPQCDGETEPLAIVGDAGQTVFAPAVGARPSLIVREVVPGVATFAVIFADGSPLPFAEIGPPFFPRVGSGASLVQSNLLSQAGHGRIARFR